MATKEAMKTRLDHELLTIAVPTYNRRDQVLNVLRAMVDQGVTDVAHVLVLDDGSTDGTAAAIRGSTIAPAIRVVEAPTNQGYARSFARLFSLCDTEFMLVSADDDFVLPEGIRDLNTELRRESETADILSTVFLRGSDVYRGRHEDRIVEPSEFRAALNHAPGIVYRVQNAKAELPRLLTRLETGCSAASTYPQVVLAAGPLCRNKVRWSQIATVSEGEHAPSGIKDATGNAYYSSASRFQQLLDFDAVFSDLVATARSSEELVCARKVLNHHHESVFPRIHGLLLRSSPSLAYHFARSALLHSVRGLLRIAVRKLGLERS